MQLKDTNYCAATQQAGGTASGKPAAEPRFSLFPAPATSVRPAGSITVWDAYRILLTDMDTLQATHELRALDPETELAARKRLKRTRFSFATFSGTFSYRNRQGLQSHSQLLSVDLDHVGEGRVEELKQRLAADRSFSTALCFRSPSGDGVKWVVGIDTSRAAHETWFDATSLYLRNEYGLQADKACRDVTRSCFLPHDGLAIIGEEFRTKNVEPIKKGVPYEYVPF